MSILPTESATHKHFILYIEDVEFDYLRVKRACKAIDPEVFLIWCKNIAELREFVGSLGCVLPKPNVPLDPLAAQLPQHFSRQFPSLILLDLNLPAEDGRVLLDLLKSTPPMSLIPIVVLSSSDSPSDVHACYQKGANSYVLKPLGAHELELSMRNLLAFWLGEAVLPTQALHLGITS